MIKQVFVDMTKDDKNFFEILQDNINEIREKIKGLTFAQAKKELDGFNDVGEYFDYNWTIDDEHYLVGTIYNKGGKPIMDDDALLYEIWYETDMLNARQVLSMTEFEIKEQIDRLQ